MWKLNSHPISTDHSDIILERRGQRVHTLIIESVSAKHIGNYTCSSNNKAGIFEFSSELLVNGLLIFCEFLFLILFASF